MKNNTLVSVIIPTYNYYYILLIDSDMMLRKLTVKSLIAKENER
jgi:hypothetical protein